MKTRMLEHLMLVDNSQFHIDQNKIKLLLLPTIGLRDGAGFAVWRLSRVLSFSEIKKVDCWLHKAVSKLRK